MLGLCKATGFGFILAVALSSSGCQLSFTSGYTVKQDPALVELKTTARLAVIPFEDKRPEKDWSRQSRLLLTAIPIIPFITFPYERLDELAAGISDEIRAGYTIRSGPQPLAPPLADIYYPNTFAKAVASDLKPYFGASDISANPKPAGYDYVLRGVLHAAPYKKWATSYCLGFIGILLWLLPFPMGGCTASVELDFWLEDALGNKVWEGKINRSTSKLICLYTSSEMTYDGSSMFLSVFPCWDDAVDSQSIFAWHFLALKEGMDQHRGEIITAVNSDIEKKRYGKSRPAEEKQPEPSPPEVESSPDKRLIEAGPVNFDARKDSAPISLEQDRILIMTMDKLGGQEGLILKQELPRNLAGSFVRLLGKSAIPLDSIQEKLKSTNISISLSSIAESAWSTTVRPGRSINLDDRAIGRIEIVEGIAVREMGLPYRPDYLLAILMEVKDAEEGNFLLCRMTCILLDLKNSKCHSIATREIKMFGDKWKELNSAVVETAGLVIEKLKQNGLMKN